MGSVILWVITLASLSIQIISHKAAASNDEYRLLQELFHRKDGSYNPKVRPVKELQHKITVGFEIALINLINLDEKNQIMKSNVWLRLNWCDFYLRWKVADHGGIDVVRIQPDIVWKPDIVLLNNADGRFEVSFKANVLVHQNGWIQWVPCTIYKSSCSIDVTYFPFDEQICELIFGSWTYNTAEVSLKFYMMDPSYLNFTFADISGYEESGTWELVDFPAVLEEKPSDRGNYSREMIRYKFKFRRKTLFYTVNLILPCVLISILSMTIFYLPADEGEKVSLAISILLALVVFLQVLVTKLLPPSSKTLPLFAKYLLFAVIIDVCAILNCIMVLNINFKTPRTHRMPRIIRVLFFGILPTLLCMKRPDNSESDSKTTKKSTTSSPNLESRRDALRPKDQSLPERHDPNCPYAYLPSSQDDLAHDDFYQNMSNKISYTPKRRRKKHEGENDLTKPPTLEEEISKAAEAVRFIAAHLKNEDDYEEVIDDWRYVAFVVDRLLFLIYVVVTVVGTLVIMLTAPQIFYRSVNLTDLKNNFTAMYDDVQTRTNTTFKDCPFEDSDEP